MQSCMEMKKIDWSIIQTVCQVFKLVILGPTKLYRIKIPLETGTHAGLYGLALILCIVELCVQSHLWRPSALCCLMTQTRHIQLCCNASRSKNTSVCVCV